MNFAHLNSERIADYFVGLWTPEQERMIESHFAACDQCAALARRLYASNYLIETWTARSVRKAGEAHVYAVPRFQSAG